MKQLLLVAACFVISAIQAQAQPYLKQVITFSLKGYSGPESEVTIRNTIFYKPVAFKFSDKDLCYKIASDKGILVRSPQLVRIFENTTNNISGYYMMDGGRVVADANDYFARNREVVVFSETDTYNPVNTLWTSSLTSYAYDTWTAGAYSASGMNTSTVRFTSYDSDSEVYTKMNYSANVSGRYDNVESGTFGVFTGTFKATSVIVKTAIPGL